MKKNITAVLAAVLAFALSMPMSAMAAEERREQTGTDGQSFSVQAVATVTAEDLAAMNLNAVVSFPVTIPLTRADSTYSGEGDVYMFGVLGDGKKLTVSVNESDTENHGIIKFRKAVGGDPQYITIDSKYFESCESSATGNAAAGFTNQNGIDNLLAKNKSETIPYTVRLHTEIEGLIPIMGEGDYVTSVPLIIHVVADNG